MNKTLRRLYAFAAAVMLAACLSGCGTEVKAKGQMIGGVSMGRGL